MSRLWPLGRSSDSELHRTRLWFADKLKRRGRGSAPAKTFLHCIALSSLHLQISLLWGTNPHAAARIAPACLLAVTAIALTSLACTQRMQLFFLLRARTEPIAPAAHTAHCTATRLSCMQILDDPVVSVATS